MRALSYYPFSVIRKSFESFVISILCYQEKFRELCHIHSLLSGKVSRALSYRFSIIRKSFESFVLLSILCYKEKFRDLCHINYLLSHCPFSIIRKRFESFVISIFYYEEKFSEHMFRLILQFRVRMLFFTVL